jgi:hypothetical protein
MQRGWKRRVRKLESSYGVVEKICPGCGGIDFEKGEGVFYGGLIRSRDDGRMSCFCKLCARRFTAMAKRREDGGLDVSEIEENRGPGHQPYG